MNRKYFFLSVNTGYVHEGHPDERCHRFYAERSKHGLYCAIVGNVVLPNGHGSNSVCATISPSKSWRKLSNSISDQGAKPGIQLSTAWENYSGIRSFIAGRDQDPISAYKARIEILTPEDIVKIFEDLMYGSELAINAGFKHIQLHAAHGYLFSLLVDSYFSKHSGFVLNKIGTWVDFLISQNIESSLRFSLLTGDKAIDENYRANSIDLLMQLPFTFFDVSSGFYNVNKRLIYPTDEVMLDARREATINLADKFKDKQIIVSGKISDFSGELLPDNIHIGICRDLIANSNFLVDMAAGCNDCMKCHYYSRGKDSLVCGQWK